MDEHWSQDFEHASITEDNREAFTTGMSKFPTQADAVIGYTELQKSAGKPFKLPESIDKLPDDQTRADFSDGVNKLIGRTIPKDMESFADVNFKDGLAEDAQVNEKFTGIIKQWAVDNKIPLETVSKLASFYNGPLAAHATEAMAEQTQADTIAKQTACQEALVNTFGSKEKVAEQSELFRRAILNFDGVKGTDKAEEIGDAMVKAGLTTNPELAKIMLKAFAPMAATSNNETNNGNNNNNKSANIDPDCGSPSELATGLCTAEEHEAWNARQVAKG